MSMLDAIWARHSVRSYNGKAPSGEAWDSLRYRRRCGEWPPTGRTTTPRGVVLCCVICGYVTVGFRWVLREHGSNQRGHERRNECLQAASHIRNLPNYKFGIYRVNSSEFTV